MSELGLIPWKIDEFCVVTAFDCIVKTYGTRISTSLSSYSLSFNQGLWDFEVSWSPSFVLVPPLWNKLGAKPGIP